MDQNQQDSSIGEQNENTGSMSEGITQGTQDTMQDRETPQAGQAGDGNVGEQQSDQQSAQANTQSTSDDPAEGDRSQISQDQ